LFGILFFLQNESRAQETDTLNEMVVSANRVWEKKKDIPQVIKIISNQSINDLKPMNTADLLEKTGSAFVQKSQQGGGSPVLRGFEANRILLVVDGIRMNNAIYRGGHLQNILRVDPYMLERVEVV
jgi:hemoglobin/transferrin/lactoferrin receptor protein